MNFPGLKEIVIIELLSCVTPCRNNVCLSVNHIIF